MSDYSPKLMTDISAIVAGCLSMPVDQIDVNSDLEDFGMDSICINELALELEKKYGISIEPGVFFDLRTVIGIADHLEFKFPSELDRFYSTTST